MIPDFLPEQFKLPFRVSRETFECILMHLSNFPTLQRRRQTGGRLQTTLFKDPNDAALVLRYTRNCSVNL